METLLEQLEVDGFAIREGVLATHEIAALIELAELDLGNDVSGNRNALSWSWVRDLAADPRLRRMVDAHLGQDALPVRAILFDKPPEANWNLGFHQDRAVALAERLDLPGFVGWSVKDGVIHALAPAEVLERMLAIRLSLDPCGAENGPLRVIPGTHRAGLLSREQVRELTNRPEVACTTEAGGVVLMKPLLLHASSAAIVPRHRRVLHIEYALTILPNGARFHQWS